MPGLTFQGQGNKLSLGPSSNRGFGGRGGFGGGGSRMPGAWIVPIVLIILCIAIITLGASQGGEGVLGSARRAVQTVTKPIEQVCSVISGPFRQIGEPSDEIEQLRQDNALYKTLVSELEEYRQQNQRLGALVQLGDTYALATKSANVIGVTSGWNRTATIDKGSNDGLRAGLGVISSCGLYGQIESVTPTTSTVRLATDANSSVGAMVQGSRARGILRGSYDGELTLEYVSVDYTVGEKDFVITSGDGGTYPQGIIIGTVKEIEPDPSKLYYRITVDPVLNSASCQEVLVLTGDEGEVRTIVNEELLASIKDSSLQTSSEGIIANATPSVNTTEPTVSDDGTQGSDGVSAPGATTSENLNATADGSSSSSSSSSAAASSQDASSSAAATSADTAGKKSAKKGGE